MTTQSDSFIEFSAFLAFIFYATDTLKAKMSIYMEHAWDYPAGLKANTIFIQKKEEKKRCSDAAVTDRVNVEKKRR